MIGANGSKIVLTTRNEAVASVMGTMPVVFKEGLSEGNYLSLFVRKAFGEGQHTGQPDLSRIALDIVEECEGVPWVAMVLGGTLHMETDENIWERVRDNNAWNSQQNDNVLPAFKLSYQQLPSLLKVCLAYCSIFPEDHHIETDKLIQLWMAQGLIQDSSATTQELEDIGMQYFNELWWRSFFQEVEENRPLFTSLCKMHDLVHDLVHSEAKAEHMVIKSPTEKIHTEVRQVSFSDYEQLGKELPTHLLEHHMLPTIYFQLPSIEPACVLFIETCISRFRHLRVLDLSDSNFLELLNIIGELKYLKYLNLSGNSSIITLPNSICCLQSLQTLQVSACTNLIDLPKNMENMISLRHLRVTIKQELFPDKGVAQLASLRSLSISGCKNLVSLSEGLQYLTNLRTLGIVDCPRPTDLPTSKKNLTALENLLITDCEQLALFEWQDIEGLKILRSLVMGGLAELHSKDVQCLKNLRSVVIAGSSQLVDLPFWLEGAANTSQYLRIARCLSFMTLPTWLEDFRALEKVEIIECPKLSSLPDNICCLAELKVLNINKCPKLSGRHQNKDRASSVHIHEIYIDGRLIQ